MDEAPSHDFDAGVYIAVFHLRRAHTIRVGRLGRFGLAAGVYLYVGSAQRGLSARLARHGRRNKPLRWHVDYLSARAAMIGAMVFARPRERECELAAVLAGRLERIIPRFGSSDCGCGGHLFYAPDFWSGL